MSIQRRWALLSLILLAFARLCWHLEINDLWWDESLSLQRAESDWLPLLLGHIPISDGINTIVTIDQHPFVYFSILRLFVQFIGEHEFILRFPALMAATLLVPMLWATSRAMTRHHAAISATTPLWAALLAALSPFYLWFGQEVRMYTLWPLLALLSTYLLLQIFDKPAGRARRMAYSRYGVILFLFLSVHYFSLFLIPVHAAYIFQKMAQQNRRIALYTTSILLAVPLLLVAIAAWRILGQDGVGDNFDSVALTILGRDLLNAFSLGLSVDINKVWWLDLIFAALLLWTIARLVSHWAAFQRRTWLLVASLIVPPLTLYIINLAFPIYMTARHMSMVSGFYLILISIGLGALWQRHLLLGSTVALLLVGGMSYSTVRYNTVPQGRMSDFASIGRYLERKIQPGDLLLHYPPEMGRLYRYYLPLAEIDSAEGEGALITQQGVPLLQRDWAETRQHLAQLSQQYQRIWYVQAGPINTQDDERQVEQWLREHLYLTVDKPYASAATSLNLFLFLPEVPVYDPPPAPMPNAVAHTFGDQIHLAGYAIGTPLSGVHAIPITLYWQPVEPIQARYKYILQLAKEGSGVQDMSQLEIVAHTEREPYDGTLSTIFWTETGKTIVEYSELFPQPHALTPAERYYILVQVYNAETLERLPLTEAALENDRAKIHPDLHTLILPYEVKP